MKGLNADAKAMNSIGFAGRLETQPMLRGREFAPIVERRRNTTLHMTTPRTTALPSTRFSHPLAPDVVNSGPFATKASVAGGLAWRGLALGGFGLMLWGAINIISGIGLVASGNPLGAPQIMYGALKAVAGFSAVLSAVMFGGLRG